MKRIGVKAIKALTVVVVIVGALVSYNYLRHVVIWYPKESVTFDSADGVRLRGLLMKPSEQGVFPAVVVLHGSGPEGMNEFSYRVTANTMLRSGLAVLIYDKRGVGASGGDFESALYRDFVADGVAAVRYLAGRSDIDATRIGLHGNSEGAWFTPEVAHETGQVAFIFNTAGSPLSWRHTVIWEVRNDLLAAGVAEEDLQPLLDITMRRWNYHVDAAGDPALAAGPERDAINAELKRLLAEVPAAEAGLPEELPPYDPATYEAWAADIRYDPGPFLEAIDVPMIYTLAQEDINMPTVAIAEFLEAFRQEHGKEIEIVVFEGVGHAMANWKGLLTAGYIPEYLGTIKKWCRTQAER